MKSRKFYGIEAIMKLVKIKGHKTKREGFLELNYYFFNYKEKKHKQNTDWVKI